MGKVTLDELNRTVVYNLNEEFQVTDSCTIQKDNRPRVFSDGPPDNYILSADSTVYLFYPHPSPLPSLEFATKIYIYNSIRYRFLWTDILLVQYLLSIYFFHAEKQSKAFYRKFQLNILTHVKSRIPKHIKNVL